MARPDWGDITIRDGADGPEIVFDNGVQGWVLPVTDNDLARLERRIVERRQAQAEASQPGADVDSVFAPVHPWPGS
ncbi:MAG TPA: hypothetical protein VME19_17700 [Streptosporangiaceae bacterium]|nr:hypothetical protein [Streptosporangiaceae bacterium]